MAEVSFELNGRKTTVEYEPGMNLLEVLRERFADNLQYGFLAWMRADIAIAHSESFQQVVSITA